MKRSALSGTLVALATSVAIVACTEKKDNNSGKQPLTTVGPGGGTLTILGGQLDRTTVKVPPNAVTSSALTISIRQGRTIATGAYQTVGPPVQVDPSAVTFARLVNVRIPFVRALLPPNRTANDVVILRRDDPSGVLSVIPPIQLDTFTFGVTFDTASFATFQTATKNDFVPQILSTESPAGGSPPLVSIGGGPVTIRGMGLFAGSTVSFGSVRVEGYSVTEGPNGTSLFVQAPPQSSPGDVDILVTTLDGRSVTFPKAFRYVSGPVFLGVPGQLTAPPQMTTTANVAAIDPAGGAVTYAVVPSIPNLSVDATGTLRFTPTLFQAGFYNVTVTATTATGSTQQTIGITVPRPTTQVLVADGDQPPGAPAALAAPLPQVDSTGTFGTFHVPVAFVGTSTTGVLRRTEAGVAVIASTGGFAAATTAVYAGGFTVGTTGADGVSGFVAPVTSDGGATARDALFALPGSGTVVGPIAIEQGTASLSTVTATAAIGTFVSFGRPLADGTGGLWFVATVTSSTNPATNVSALYRWSGGAPTCVTLPGEVVAAGRTIQAGSTIVLAGASAGTALARVVTEAGASYVRFGGASGPIVVSEPGQVLAVGGTTRAIASVTSAHVAKRTAEASVLLVYGTGETAVHAFSATAPISSEKVVAEGLDSLGGVAVNAITSFRTGIEDVTTAVAAVASATAGEWLVRRGVPLAGPASTTPIGGTFASFERLDGGGSALAWVSPVAGGTRPSALFFSATGGSQVALVREGDALFAGTVGTLLGTSPHVHPETTLVVATVPVVGASFSSVIIVR